MTEKIVSEMSDMGEITFLLCEGFTIERTEWKDKRVVCIVGHNGKDKDKLLAEYYTHKANVSPLKFHTELKGLKGLIYTEKRKQNGA